MSLSSYGRLATEVYDIDKPIGHSFGDVEFYLGRLRSCTTITVVRRLKSTTVRGMMASRPATTVPVIATWNQHRGTSLEYAIRKPPMRAEGRPGSPIGWS
ncbi:MAG: SAM-dependent methyltransferase [uncultured Rubrobacteraceae bacterium]|uniref:SAM-dependent methyltransferase n=1 Tax=uncultured Rubrobacteraceae bacterium TaxID=349277 RepID=A0A6J4R1G5_9ACTN|nr:MAG: SAM-dependent methyltransferase [uncultured Rubrobacteraceae bacterium]